MSTPDNQSVDTTQRFKGRVILILIVAIPVVIILLSTLLYYLVDTKAIDVDTVNKGELITPPILLSNFTISTTDGGIFSYEKPEPKWTFVIFGGGECNSQCEKMMYLSRQTNIALAKKMNRVRRYFISHGNVLSQDQLEKKYFSGVTVLSMSKMSIEKMFVGTNIDPFQNNSLFVVDSRGWLMMHYAVEGFDQQSLNKLGKDILKDMKRLVK